MRPASLARHGSPIGGVHTPLPREIDPILAYLPPSQRRHARQREIALTRRREPYLDRIRFALDIQNRLLASLGAADLTHLRRHLREIPIEQGEMLEEPGHSVEAGYFPQTGMISLIVQMPEDSSVEILSRCGRHL